jgi:hypothetical protein
LPTPTYHRFQYPEDLKRSDTFDFENSNAEFADLNTTIYQDYISWVQIRMNHYRLTSLPLLVSLGECFSGDLVDIYLDEIIHFNDIVPFSCSPFGWTKANTLGFACPPKFGNALLSGITLSYATFDLVAGVGRYDLSQFPDEVSLNENFYKLLERSISHMITEVENQ